VTERQRPQIDAVGNQKVEGDIGRPAATAQQLVEQRAPGVVERDKLAVEDVAFGKRSSTPSKRFIRLPLREISRPRTTNDLDIGESR
jgi:hypothetical protein